MEQRGVKKIVQYNSPKMTYPTPEQISAGIERVGYLWKSGDMYWKLAASFYGDAELWWVIAWYNKKPTESHIEIGDTIQVPMPLNTVLKYLRG